MKHQDIIDDTIERALVRDSQTLPTFPTDPNSTLTAKLAISIASKGMLSTFSAKLALFGGVALVAGAALYYSSSQNSTPSTQVMQSPPLQSVTITSDTTKRDSVKLTQAVASVAKSKGSAKIKTTHLEPSQPKVTASVPKDTATIPHIQNPNYQPPLK